MKKKYWKTVILLTLVATLLTGILLGCNDGTDLGNFNDDIIGGGTCHPEWDAAPAEMRNNRDLPDDRKVGQQKHHWPLR